VACNMVSKRPDPKDQSMQNARRCRRILMPVMLSAAQLLDRPDIRDAVLAQVGGGLEEYMMDELP